MEYLDIVNENDEVIGKEERNEAHKQHLLHRAVHIIIANDKDEILLQFRTATKKQYPSYWAGSAAGHVTSGETAQECAQKELSEEIGIHTDLEFIGKFIINNDVEHEMVSVFFGKSNGPFKLEEEEVAKAEFFSVDKLKEKKDTMKMTPHCKKALELVFERYFS